MKRDLKIVFAGTPHFAATILTELVKQYSVIGVYTQPDRAAGRGQKLTACPVKLVAEEHHLAVFQPKSLRSLETQQTLATLKPDLIIVVAYGLILPKAVLDLPKYGCLNVHASLLPRWRGAAPIQRAILNGDAETGVTIMQMNEGLDTGDMLLKKSCGILKTDTSESLHDTLAALGSEALMETLSKLDHLTPERQDDAKTCYAEKIEKQEGRIDWQLPAEQIDRMIRAFTPWPGTFTTINNHVFKILQSQLIDSKTDKAPGTIIQANKQGLDIATSAGILRVTRCQLPGGKILAFSDVFNAKKDLFTIGTRL